MTKLPDEPTPDIEANYTPGLYHSLVLSGGRTKGWRKGDGPIDAGLIAISAFFRVITVVLSAPSAVVRLISGVVDFYLLARRMRRIANVMGEKVNQTDLDRLNKTDFERLLDKRLDELQDNVGDNNDGDGEAPRSDLDSDQQALHDALDVLEQEFGCFLLVARLGDTDYHPDDRPDGPREFALLSSNADTHKNTQLRKAVQRWLDDPPPVGPGIVDV